MKTNTCSIGKANNRDCDKHKSEHLVELQPDCTLECLYVSNNCAYASQGNILIICATVVLLTTHSADELFGLNIISLWSLRLFHPGLKQNFLKQTNLVINYLQNYSRRKCYTCLLLHENGSSHGATEENT